MSSLDDHLPTERTDPKFLNIGIALDTVGAPAFAQDGKSVRERARRLRRINSSSILSSGYSDNFRALVQPPVDMERREAAITRVRIADADI
jgi:hypothetical protein